MKLLKFAVVALFLAPIGFAFAQSESSCVSADLIYYTAKSGQVRDLVADYYAHKIDPNAFYTVGFNSFRVDFPMMLDPKNHWTLVQSEENPESLYCSYYSSEAGRYVDLQKLYHPKY